MLDAELLHRVSKTPERVRLGIDILRVAAAGSLVLASFAMPNLVKMLPLLKLHRMKREYREWDVSRALRRLRHQGFVTLVPTRNGHALRLTKKGQVLLARYELGQFKLSVQKRWDGRWRMIIFDIDEGKKRTRDLVRLQLKRWGFYQVQRSAWAYPYECEEAIELLKTAHFVRRDIYYLVIARMAGDKKMREHFSLIRDNQ